jgi:hypothetical protein
MACGFQLKVSAESCGCGCSCVPEVKDATGLYNSVTNPSGWGTPNPEFTDVESASLTFNTFEGGTPVIVDVTDYYASETNLGTPFDLTSIPTNTFTDGGWTVELQVIGISGEDSFTYRDVNQFWVDCNTRFCIAKLASSIVVSDCECGCPDVKSQKYADAMFYLQGAKDAFMTCQYAKANELLAAAQNICSTYCVNC